MGRDMGGIHGDTPGVTRNSREIPGKFTVSSGMWDGSGHSAVTKSHIVKQNLYNRSKEK